jgi:hypothetical protein
MEAPDQQKSYNVTLQSKVTESGSKFWPLYCTATYENRGSAVGTREEPEHSHSCPKTVVHTLCFISFAIVSSTLRSFTHQYITPPTRDRKAKQCAVRSRDNVCTRPPASPLLTPPLPKSKSSTAREAVTRRRRRHGLPGCVARRREAIAR